MSDESGETGETGEIALHRKGGIDRILAGGGPRTQRMRGFEEHYTDIVDYIIRSTHRIWEEQGVGLIYTHYGHNTIVHGGYDETYGREAVIASSLQALAAFPDRTLYGDEVIWGGDDERGFDSSHHLTIIGHNTGYSAYGPPTGRRAEWRVIAHCFVRENRVLEEWLVRDEVAVIRQLGFDPDEVALRQLRAEPAGGVRFLPHGKVERGVGQRSPEPLPPPAGDGFDVADFVRRSYHDVWNRRLLNTLRETHAGGYQVRTAGGRRFSGRDDYAGFVLAILGAFPDAKLTIDHLDWLGNERDGFRVATRWTLAGSHRGPSEWGEPTGAQVRVLGLSHHRIEDGRFVAESSVFDELGLLKQLWAARLAAPTPVRGPKRRRDAPVAPPRPPRRSEQEGGAVDVASGAAQPDRGRPDRPRRRRSKPRGAVGAP